MEIGAVRLKPHLEADPVHHFGELVTPSINPVLSDYFITLTGITQRKLELRGLELQEALEKLAVFTQGADAIYSYGEDADVIAENCALVNISNPIEHLPAVNARHMIQKAYDLPATVSSCELPAATGLQKKTSSYRPHRALDDARAVARVLCPLLRAEAS